MNQYLPKIDILLEAYAPLKKLNKKELEFLTKPWITQGLQNSIKNKNNIYSKLVKCKNQNLKEFYHNNYKTYRNLLSTLFKRAKQKYFTKSFNENIKVIKKTWIGIKSLVSISEVMKNTSMTQSQLQILSITFSHQQLKNSSFQTSSLEVFYQQKSMTLS